MSLTVAIAYHSGYGHTARQAHAAASGAVSVARVAVESSPDRQVGAA